MTIEWSLSDFDDKGRQRPPIGLVVALLYISRHLVFLVMATVSRLAGTGNLPVFNVLGLPPVWILPISMASLALLLLMLNRERLEQRSWWRQLMGRLIAVLLALDVMQAILLAILQGQALLRLDILPTLELMLLGACLYYLATEPIAKLLSGALF
jgi:hypothetical protein